ncbi:MAG TPA: hypothetical protein VLV86_06110 [Vicinamibacterales bacterium]|nr:hypothetical protein [Vicinamibacterales bacterium]
MRFVSAAFAATVLLTAGQTRYPVHAAEKLDLRVSPTVSMAPASVIVRAIVEHDANNRELEIVADSSDFYRRSVVDLDGEQAPKLTELKLIDIPSGEYEITATLYLADGTKTRARRSVMVVSQNIGISR